MMSILGIFFKAGVIDSVLHENVDTPSKFYYGREKNMRDEILNGIVSGLNLPPAIAQKLMNKYLETLPKDIEQLKENIAQEDFPTAAKTAHSIKGASGNLRVTKIYELASELEQIFKAAQEDSMGKVDALISELDEIMKKLM
jgi:HPt (histidine-containing phosphotransfer) domain-containing protein